MRRLEFSSYYVMTAIGKAWKIRQELIEQIAELKGMAIYSGVRHLPKTLHNKY